MVLENLQWMNGWTIYIQLKSKQQVHTFFYICTFCIVLKLPSDITCNQSFPISLTNVLARFPSCLTYEHCWKSPSIKYSHKIVKWEMINYQWGIYANTVSKKLLQSVASISVRNFQTLDVFLQRFRLKQLHLSYTTNVCQIHSLATKLVEYS